MGNRHFQLVEPERSGINFINSLNPTEEWNIIDYLYYYNGAGVAIGDIDNDQHPDVFFTSNEGSNTLYKNLGGMKFEDISEAAGITSTGWSTGVTMADVNGDGWLDIYVCQVGQYKGQQGSNKLYINNQDGTFTDRAEEYGLQFEGLSTQAAFFDYDLDGDLDLYLLNHSVHSVNTYGAASMRNQQDDLAGDRLYRNNLDRQESPFTDVTREAGIYTSQIGYGLGLAITDYNADGWPDIYVSNDFHENDYLYRNQGDGTFVEVGETVFPHTSRYSMGNETGDVNNDGLIDIVTLDMLPGDPEILRKSASEDRIEVSEIKSQYGYGSQLVRNSLQINSGNESFSDLGPMAGIYATDWSWGALLFDMDNDGWSDLYITNGIVRRPNDLDYIQYLANSSRNKSSEPTDAEMIEQMPVLKIPNYAYHNQHSLQFVNKAEELGLSIPSFSNGAAYGDLDGDGDLDLVVNNINDLAFVFENTGATGNFLHVTLQDTSLNTFGLGSRINLYSAAGQQLREVSSTRGFMSSVSPTVHFGLGDVSEVDSLEVIWPGGRRQVHQNVKANQHLTLTPEGSDTELPKAGSQDILPITKPFTWKHMENPFKDYTREPLIPYNLSSEGPAIAVGDVNGDGLDDVFFGGAHGQPATLFYQDARGNFLENALNDFSADRMYEDVDAALVDIDNDGDLDLYVVSGGNEYAEGHNLLRDRIYYNNGGIFSSEERIVLNEALNGSCIAFADINQDGFMDAFVGIRSVPGAYGTFAESYLLMNNGAGMLEKDDRFTLEGMVTDAIWFDVDGDGDEDLCVVGEWMPITLFENREGEMHSPPHTLANSNGWWKTVEVADLDGDGTLDILAGNAGLNMKLKATVDKPVELYFNDFDGNGQSDPLIFYWQEEENIPFASKDEIDRQIPIFKKGFTSYADYAGTSDLPEKIRQLKKDGLIVRKADTFASTYFLNGGNFSFTGYPLPEKCQWTVIQDIFLGKEGLNGERPIILGGNSYAVNIGIGRADAMPGVVLLTGGGKKPEVITTFLDYGLMGEYKAIEPVVISGKKYLILIQNNQSPVVVPDMTMGQEDLKMLKKDML